jgi:1-acyl-sn-glycerol-3-phosphate acyltransferase
MIASVLAGVARLIAGTTVHYIEAAPDTQQRVFIANHSSHLDFIVLWSSLPPEVRRNTRPVAARDYWNKGFRKYLADNVFHAVLIERTSGNATPAKHPGEIAVEAMRQALDDGSSLILFPEGTRGSGEQLGEFRSGIYHLCKDRSGLLVQPVYMKNLNRILPKGQVYPIPLLGKVVFGKPISLEVDEDKAAFLVRCRDAVKELMRI